jgi:hypothetical protein
MLLVVNTSIKSVNKCGRSLAGARDDSSFWDIKGAEVAIRIVNCHIMSSIHLRIATSAPLTA